MWALNIIVAAIGILISVASNKTVTATEAKGEAYNVAVVDGLHVALPYDMRTFPVEIVPLP